MTKVAIERDDSSGQMMTAVCCNYLGDVVALQGRRVGPLVPGDSCCIQSEGGEGGDQVHGQAGDQGDLRVQDTRGSCHLSYQ